MKGVLTGLKPDITPAQVVAVLIYGLPQILVLLGVHLGPEQTDALDELRWLALGLIGGDAALRVARNSAGAKVEAAALSAASVPPQLPAGVLPEREEAPAGAVGTVSGSGALDPEEEALLAEDDASREEDEPPLLDGESAGAIGENAGDPPRRPA